MRFIRGFFAAWLTLALMAQLSIDVRPAHATVNSSVNKTIVLGNGAQTQFTFNFIGVAAAYISVILTDASGNETVLARGAGATQYQIVLNAPVAGAIWGIGGTVTYNPSGTPVPSGSSLTIFRTLPLTQAITLQNQSSIQTLGKGAETGLDTSVMQAQQISENIARAIVAPVSDPTPPLPLPPIAQRANQGAAFDGDGNLVAGAMPSSGVISPAMQPVVNAATLAAGRSAFGLGGMAVEGIGSGLQDDGTGNVRVNSALTSVAVNQAADATFSQRTFIATGPITFTLARANTLWNGYGFTLFAFTGAITFTPNAADNFPGLAGGDSYIVPAGSVARITTDAAATGNWYIQLVPQVLAPPQGYLTPCSATVVVAGCTSPFLVPTASVTAVSTLYYQAAPAGNQIPLWNGSSMMMVPFPELVLTLNGTHLPNTLYDVCVTLAGGAPTVVTGPAWQTSTPGSGARGASTAIVRKNGIWTNNIAITGRNGASTFAIPANQCTVVGTISIGAVAGLLNFNRSVGQARRWDVSNIYNRQAISLAVADPNLSWGPAGAFFRVSRGDPNNYALALNSVPEETVFAQLTEFISLSYGNNSILGQVGIGINVTTAATGLVGQIAASDNISGSFTSGGTVTAKTELAPALGLNQLFTLDYGVGAALFSGTAASMRMTVSWRG